MDARQIPFNYCYLWIKCSIKIAERYYSLFLGCALLYFVAGFAIPFIPFIGRIASTPLMFLYAVASMRLMKQVRDTGTATFDDYLKYSFDTEFIKRCMPYIAILVSISVCSEIFSRVHIGFVLSLSAIFGFFIMAATVHAAYMLSQNPSLDWKQALKNVFNGLWINIVPWITHYVIFVSFAVVCAVLCFLPLLLYFLPMTLPLNYLVYSSIFEGLDIEHTIAEWNNKANAVQTVEITQDEP